MYFDGTGDYLITQAPTNNLYSFGTGNFTIEMWVYFTNTSAEYALVDSRTSATGNNEFILYKEGTGTNLIWYTAGTARITGTIPGATQWIHIAVCRSSGTTKMFVNGTQSGSSYSDTNSYNTAATKPIIGGDSASLGSRSMNGYIDELRITKGYARYTSNFVSPSGAVPRN